MKKGGEFLTTQIGAYETFTPEKFSEEQRDIGKTVEEFARNRIRPNKEAIETYNKELSLQLLRECAELGLLSVDIPEKYGGLGLDKVTSAIVVENISQGLCASFSATFGAHSGIGTLPIVFFGTEAQKEKYLPKLASTELVSAYALTEPESGSDALAAKSTATLSEDKKFFVLNGSKQFITNASWADLFIIFANVGGRAFTGFIVERTTGGLSVGPEEHKMGIKGSSTCSVFLENARVPAENVLGQIGGGAAIAFNTLNIGRFKLGAATLGGCKVTITEALNYATQRRQFGQAIRNFDVIQSYFAEMVIDTFALESVIYRTIGLIDEAISGIPQSAPDYQKQVADAIEQFAIEASMCKILGSETLWSVADKGVQIFGGYGFVEEYPLASVLRDNRIDRIYEGTNEINRQIIAGYFLRKALMEELPVRAAIKRMDFEHLDKLANAFKQDDAPLAREKTSVEMAKAFVLYAFHEAICKYGQDLKNEQQIGSLLSDMFADIYLMDSALARASQIIASRGNVDATLLAIVRTFCAEKIDEVSTYARKVLCAVIQEDKLPDRLREVRAFEDQMRPATNVIELKRRVAQDLYEAGRYRF